MANNLTFWNPKEIVWFSCGAISAVLAKIAVQVIPHDRLIVCHCDSLAEEHEDNARFKRDVEQWIGFPITTIKSRQYDSPTAVFDGEQYMVGPRGARCTTELKKIPRLRFAAPEDWNHFGFTADEADRIRDFERRNPDLRLTWILAELGLTKQDCLAWIAASAIKMPAMYGLGFDHNNCKGCVKPASPAYWNLTRRLFPDVFAARAEQSRRIGCRLVTLHGERIFLDELPPEETERIEEVLSCGPECGGS